MNIIVTNANMVGINILAILVIIVVVIIIIIIILPKVLTMVSLNYQAPRAQLILFEHL